MRKSHPSSVICCIPEASDFVTIGVQWEMLRSKVQLPPSFVLTFFARVDWVCVMRAKPGVPIVIDSKRTPGARAIFHNFLGIAASTHAMLLQIL